MTRADVDLIDNAILRAKAHSPFLSGLIARYPEIPAILLSEGLDATLRSATEDDDSSVSRRLRRQRARLILTLALADLAGIAGFEAVTSTLSGFADIALDTAISTAIGEHAHGAPPAGFVAIALGKHGSRELNFSSDIDPIFLYDPATLPKRPREEPGEAAVRIARRVVELLQTRDADGYVFRVDLRLRPASEATPIALPVEAAMSHYESSALAWERAAFIRARAAAGDVALGTRFLKAIEPFVWRRSLDFGAVADIRTLTRAIRDHHAGQTLEPGYDLKRGRGGIREVEFYAQIHQLIHGGRDASLRSGTTLPALAALANAGWIAAEEAEALGAAYRLLRTIEHRVQMIDDRQTHQLPLDAVELDGVAKLHGLNDGSALVALLAPHIDRVGKTYDGLDRGDGDAPSVIADVEGSAFTGFADPATAMARVERWRAGSVRSIRSPAAVRAFEALLPDVLADMMRAPDPDAALARFDALLGRLSSGVNLFRLLDAQPGLRLLLIDILAYAPVLADALAIRPALLDRLVDRTALGPVPDLEALVTEMRSSNAPDTETLLDRVRHVVGEYRFALGVQIVEGAADPLEVAAGYGRVASAAVEVVAAQVVADFERAHGRVPGGELVVVGLGRFGGGLLTHASDLDLVYLFTGDFAAESDGARPLGATHYFNRLGQRLSAALSVPTSVGALYEVDTRLRPSGAQGPLVASLDSFARYQREAAWTWEHMALCRARAVYGTPAGRRAVEDVIGDVLRTPRDTDALVRRVVEMRADIATHKPPQGDLDVKLGPGGLVDAEFVVHFAQLSTGVGIDPDLRVAVAALAKAETVDPELGVAHDLLTRLLVVFRLVAPDLEIPDPATRALVARACGCADWDALLAELASARQCVTRHWTQIVARAGETA